MDNSWKGGFFRFSSWSFKEHFKSQNYLYNTSENEDLWHTCSHLKAWHGRVAVTGAALCMGWEAALLMGFSTISDRVTDPMFLWRILCSVHSSLPASLSLSFALMTFHGLFSFANNMQSVTMLASVPDINFLPHGHLKPLVLCLGNCNNLSDIFPPCFLSRTVLNGFLKHTSFLHLRK